MKIGIGSDHFGYPLKEVVYKHISGRESLEIIDFGVSSEEEVVLYPDIALKVALAVKNKEIDYGILICGTGIGMSITANKIPGVYAALVENIYGAERAKKSNNSNIITMGSQVVGPEVAKKLVDIWLSSDFQGGRSTPKVNRIYEIEGTYLKEG